MRVIEHSLVSCIIIQSPLEDILAEEKRLNERGLVSFDMEDMPGGETWVWFIPNELKEKSRIRINLTKKTILLLNKNYVRGQVRLDDSGKLYPLIDVFVDAVNVFMAKGAGVLVLPQVAGKIEVVELKDD